MNKNEHLFKFFDEGGERPESGPRGSEPRGRPESGPPGGGCGPESGPGAVAALPEELPGGARLRPYQSRALRAWVAAGCRGILAMPTGSGKTVVALAAMRALSRRTLIVAPSLELVEQWRRAIARLLREPASTHTGGGQSPTPARRAVTTYHSAARLLEGPNGFDMVVFDECHHLRAPSWIRLLGLSEGKMVLGLTATPEEVPGLPVVCTVGLEEAMRGGGVSRYEARVVEVSPTPEAARAAMPILRRIEVLRGMLAGATGSESRAEILTALARLYQSLRIILEADPPKLEALGRLLGRDRPPRALVFVETIEGSEEVAGYLRRLGWNALAYHSAMDPGRRRAALEALASGNCVLVAAKALDEGVDVPSVKWIAVLSCPKRPRRFVQRMGRGLRPGEPLRLYVVTTAIGEVPRP